MSTTKDRRKELHDLIEQAKAQLNTAESEALAWNKGKYQSSSNAKISKLLVKSIENAIAKHKQELAMLSENDT